MRVERIQKVNPGEERNLPPFPSRRSTTKIGRDRQRQIDRDKAREREREICKRINAVSDVQFSSIFLHVHRERKYIAVRDHKDYY